MTTENKLAIRQTELIMTPDEVVANATTQAKLLMDIVLKSKCYQQIHDKKYLQVEAWETIGAFNKTHAETESISPIVVNGETEGYQAHVQLWRDGVIVGGAIMPAYFTENCCKGKEGAAKHKAAMSAAQTFATSKAYRMNYSYVAILAGFEATPAEEITGEDTTQPQYDKHFCKVHNTAFFKKGNMKGYAHPIEGTEPKQWCNETEPSPPSPQPQTEGVKAEEPTNLPIDIKWLQEQQDYLKKKGIKSWSNSHVLSKLNEITKLIGNTSITAAIKVLTPEQAAAFTKEVEEAIKMT